MEKKRYIPHTICLILMAAAFLALSVNRKIYGNPDAPVSLKLPDTLGAYTAYDILFCQNPKCGRMQVVSSLSASNRCTVCNGELDPISTGEKSLLPDNTPIFRKIYKAPDGRNITATLVFSGIERRSIHKPQVCLKAQGNIIRNESTIRVDIPGRDPLDVRLLDIASIITFPDGTAKQQLGLYAYWFFNPETETPYHNLRLSRMAFDNIFRSYRPRWAYVIVATQCRYKEQTEDIQAISDFIPLLMPVINDLRRRMREAEEQPPPPEQKD